MVADKSRPEGGWPRKADCSTVPVSRASKGLFFSVREKTRPPSAPAAEHQVINASEPVTTSSLCCGRKRGIVLRSTSRPYSRRSLSLSETFAIQIRSIEMRDFHNHPVRPLPSTTRPVGFFLCPERPEQVLRTCRIIDALPAHQPATVFCSDATRVSGIAGRAEIVEVPRLTKPCEHVATGSKGLWTLNIEEFKSSNVSYGLAKIASWFACAKPGLVIAEAGSQIVQFARAFSVPYVTFAPADLRLGSAHQEAHLNAVGILVPCHEALAQDVWPTHLYWKTHFAAGLERVGQGPARRVARERLGLPMDKRVVLALAETSMSFPSKAALAAGAAATPDHLWIVAGSGMSELHRERPDPLKVLAKEAPIAEQLAAADIVVSTASAVAASQVLSARKPWLVVPHQRGERDQTNLARALCRAKAAHVRQYLPTYTGGWRLTLEATERSHDPIRQAILDHPGAAVGSAAWIEGLCSRRNGEPSAPQRLNAYRASGVGSDLVAI